MCLDHLEKFKMAATHTDGSVKGWKVFLVNEGRLHPILYGNHCYLSGKWNYANTATRLNAFTREEGYDSGFHIYKTKKECRDRGWHGVIVPVYFMPKDIIAKGLDGGHKCIVAKRMWIEPHDYDKAVNP